MVLEFVCQPVEGKETNGAGLVCGANDPTRLELRVAAAGLPTMNGSQQCRDRWNLWK